MSRNAGVLTLNGVDLDRWTVTRGTFYRPPVSVRRSSVSVPSRHGVIPVGLPVFDEPTVTVELAPAPAGRPDVAALESLTADLVGVLSSPSLVLRRTVAGRVEEAPAVLVSASPSEEFIWGSHARWTVSLAIPGVFLRGVEAQTHTAAGFDWGTAPVADAVVRFPAGSVDPYLLDDTSGTGVSWLGTVPAGRWLYVSAATLAAWTSSSSTAWSGGGTDVSAGVDYPADGPLQVWPTSTVEAAGALYPSTSLYPSVSLYPSTGGGDGELSRSTVLSGSTGWAIYGRSAWL